MEIKINIKMDNAAFEDSNGIELARILRRLADRVDETERKDGDGEYLFDKNGNRVGHWEVTEDTTEG